MTTPTRIALLRATYHRGRREYTWWTGGELDGRCGSTGVDRQGAVKAGLLITQHTKSSTPGQDLAYHITAAGIAAIQEHEASMSQGDAK